MKVLSILLGLMASSALFGNVEEGKKVFAANCAICHTTNGGRAMGPDMNLVAYTRRTEEIAAYVKDPSAHFEAFGYSANAMPTLPLEEQEFKDVADYISSLQPFKKWMIKKKKANPQKN